MLIQYKNIQPKTMQASNIRNLYSLSSSDANKYERPIAHTEIRIKDACQDSGRRDY